MDEALEWLRWIDPMDAKILWLRATGDRWKAICWQVGLARTAAHQHWIYGLSVIAWRLQGHHMHGKRSRRRVMEQIQAGNR